MFAKVENVKILGARPLTPRAPEPGQTARLPQCEISCLVNGPLGPEMKKFKAPIEDLAEFLPLIDKTVDSIAIDVNEWDMNGKRGVTYKVTPGTTK